MTYLLTSTYVDGDAFTQPSRLFDTHLDDEPQLYQEQLALLVTTYLSLCGGMGGDIERVSVKWDDYLNRDAVFAATAVVKHTSGYFTYVQVERFDHMLVVK